VAAEPPFGRARRRRASTSAEILRLSWPVIASQALVGIAGLIDRAMVGRLGDGGAAVPLAAVGFATQFFFLIQSTLFAVGIACVALMARAIGSGDRERARQALAASLRVAVGVTLLLAGLMLVGARPALGWLGAEQAVIDAALPYLRFVVCSSIALAVTLVVDSAMRANRDMQTPMWIAGIVMAVKLFGNWVLIFGHLGMPRLELVGAGLATAISQLAGLLVFAVILARVPRDSPLRLNLAALRRTSPLDREVIRISMPGIAERLVMNLALLSYFWVLGHYYGTVAVAAYTVGIALLSFSWLPGQGFAQACATLVGQALGAGKPGDASKAGLRSAALALGSALVLGVVCGVARYPLARMFTSDEAVVAALGPFMLILAIAQPFLQLHFTLGGAHRGAGDTWSPLVAATVGNWALRVPLAMLFATVLHTGILWVWGTIIVDHVARAAYLGWSFRRGRWLRA